MALGSAALTGLAHDWRALLFPQADDAQFADGYAQAVTFGLLVARALDISLSAGTEMAAQELKKSNSLIGTALRLLTEDTSNQEALKTSLGTLTRVLGAVNWHTITKDDPKEWLYFYEQFLEVYDNALRKRTGSYYTPPEVVSAMVNLVDEALRGPLFERAAGFASADVIVADPAVGTGTFLLGVLRRIQATVTEDQGAGAVRGAIEAAAKRIIGFEIQFGPFAVAQLRLIAELQSLMDAPPLPDPRLFITDTLGNPFIEEEKLGQTYEPIAISRRAANKVKTLDWAGGSRAAVMDARLRSVGGRRLRSGASALTRITSRICTYISGAGRPLKSLGLAGMTQRDNRTRIATVSYVSLQLPDF
jgi:N-6 DNA Methylase